MSIWKHAFDIAANSMEPMENFTNLRKKTEFVRMEHAIKSLKTIRILNTPEMVVLQIVETDKIILKEQIRC